MMMMMKFKKTCNNQKNITNTQPFSNGFKCITLTVAVSSVFDASDSCSGCSTNQHQDVNASQHDFAIYK